MVILVPSDPKTWAISALTYPPPRMTIEAGSSSSRMTVSDVTYGTSVRPGTGGTFGREPVDRTTCSPRTSSPPTRSTLGATNSAAPT